MMLAQDLHRDGALAGDDIRVVERMDEGQLVLLLEIERVGVRVRVRIAEQHDLGAACAHGFDLHLRRGHRHHDHRPAPQLLRSERHALRVVAGRRGDHAALQLLARQPRHLVVGAAQLEALDGLQVLALQQDAIAEALGQARRLLERRLDRNVVHPRRQDATQILLGRHRHPSPCFHRRYHAGPPALATYHPGMEKDQGAPYAGLTPDTVLNAVDSAGLITDGRQLALNSYENRVFQVGLDDGRFVVVKFYRPGRWTDDQILEEHAFTAELAELEVPAVPALELDGRTLHAYEGFRFTVFPRSGGRAPNLDDPGVREWLGRFLGRIHAVGAVRPFAHRPALDAETFGVEPRRFLIDHAWLPRELAGVYDGVSQQALDGVARCYERAGDVGVLRLHGDCHEGNVLWTDSPGNTGPHFVDFDDSRTGPAVQDLWMLLGADRDEQTERLSDMLLGYEDFAGFDRRELHLVEALRTLRLLHYSAWIARRWDDPAFPSAFPWFNTQRYWEDRILELREQVAAMQEPPLVA